jgi:hypothetical protein
MSERSIVACARMEADGPVRACSEVIDRLAAAQTADLLGHREAADELRRQAKRHADVHRAEVTMAEIGP